MGSKSSGSFPLALTKCAFWEEADASVEPRYLILWIPSFSGHFPSHVSGSYLDSRVLNMLNSYINSLGKNLVLNLFVYDNAHCMLGNIVDLQFFHGNICGAFLSEQCPLPMISTISPFL